MIKFLSITIQEKGTDDYRAFLDWANKSTMTRYQLRGYGATPHAAAEDAWKKYNEDRDFYIEHEEPWV